MPNQDFYVTFGSNAQTWAKNLSAQLKPARDAIRDVAADLAKLEQDAQATSAKIAQRLTGTGAAGAGAAAGGGTGGGETAPATVQIDVTPLERAVQQAAATINAQRESAQVDVAPLEHAIQAAAATIHLQRDWAASVMKNIGTIDEAINRLGAYDDEISNIVGRVAGIVQANVTLAEEIKGLPDAIKEIRASISRSAGQEERQQRQPQPHLPPGTTGTRRRQFGWWPGLPEQPAGGQFAGKTDPRLTQAGQQPPATQPPPTAEPPQTIRETPAALVGQAAVDRLTGAVEENVVATRDNAAATRELEAAINRLAATGFQGAQEHEYEPGDVEEHFAQREQQLLQRVDETLQKVGERVEQAPEPEEPQPAEEQPRLKAAEEQPRLKAEEPGLTAQQRAALAERRGLIELAGLGRTQPKEDREAQLAGLTMGTLGDILKAFAQEGYESPLVKKTGRFTETGEEEFGIESRVRGEGGKKRATRLDDLVQAVVKIQGEFEDAGETTKNNIIEAGRGFDVEMTAATKEMIEPVLRMIRAFRENAELQGKLALGFAQGGHEQATIGDLSATLDAIWGGRAKGKEGDAAELAGVLRKPAPPEEGEEARLRKFGETLSEAAKGREGVTATSLHAAMQLTRDPKFNLLDPRIAAQFQGPEKRYERESYATLVRSTAALDELGEHAVKLQRALDDAESKLRRLGATASQEERQRLEAGVRAAEEKRAPYLPFLDPGFQEGRRLRQPFAAARAEATQVRAEQQSERLAKRQETVGSIRDFMFRLLPTMGTSTLGQSELRRRLPQLAISGKGQVTPTREGEAELIVGAGTARTQAIQRLQKAYTSFERSWSALANAEDRSAEGAAKLRGWISDASKNFVAAYSELFGELQGGIAGSAEHLVQQLLKFQGLDLEEMLAAQQPRLKEPEEEPTLKAAEREEEPVLKAPVAEAPAPPRKVAAEEEEPKAAEPPPPVPPVPPRRPAPPPGGRGGAPGGMGPGDADRIIAVLQEIHATIKAGIPLKPAAGGRKAPPGEPVEETPVEELEAPRRRRRQQQRVVPALPSTPGQRQQLFGALPDDIRAMIAAEDHLGAAITIINRDIMGQTKTLGLFRSELKQDADAALAWQTKVKQAVGDAGIQQAIDDLTKPAGALPDLPDVDQGPSEKAIRDHQRKRQEAYTKLTPDLQGQVDELEKMVALDADENEILAQRIRIYHQLEAELRKQGSRTAGVRQAASHLLGTSQQPMGGGQVAGIADMAAQARPLLENQGKQMGGWLRQAWARTMGDHGFWGRVVNSTGTFIVRNFSAGIVFGITNALQNAMMQAVETQSTFVKISSSLEATGRSTAGLRTMLGQISTDYGIALQDVYETTAGLVGLFETPVELAGAARVVGQLQTISRGALNAAEATSVLSSITSSFGQQGTEGLQHIADVLTVIQERVGVNIETTGEGIARMAGLAQQVGLSFEETGVFVAEIAKRTGQTGAAAGEQFSRIISVMQSGRGRSVLSQALGPASGIDQALGNRDLGEAIKILMANYQGLTKAQQDNVAVTLGGARQQAAFQALLLNGSKTLTTLTAAENAHGQAAERTAQIQRSLSAQLEKFQANIVNLGAALLQSGVADFFVLLLRMVNGLLGELNKLFSTINDYAEQNPLVGFLQHTTVGMVGLALAIVGVRKALASLRKVFGVAGESLETVGLGGIADLLPGGRRRAREKAEGEGGESDAAVRRAARNKARAEAQERTKYLRQEQGFVTGTMSSFYERQGQRTERLQQRLTESADRQQERRIERARRSLSGPRGIDLLQSPLPTRASLREARNLERGGTFLGAPVTFGRLTRPLRESAAASRLAEGATRKAATATKGMATALGGMAAVAGGATAAIGSLVAVLLFGIAEHERRAQLARQVDEMFAASKARREGKTEEQAKAEEYVGPATQAHQERIKQSTESFWGTAQAAVESWWYSLSHPTAHAPRLGKHGLPQLDTGVGEAQDTLLGDLPKAINEHVDDVMRGVSISLNKSWQPPEPTPLPGPWAPGKAPLDTGAGGRNDPLAQMFTHEKTQLEWVQENSDAAVKQLDDLEDWANAQKLEPEQKTNILAQIEQKRVTLADSIAKQKLAASGVGEVNALQDDQFEQLDILINGLSNLSTDAADFFQDTIKSGIADVHLDPKANLTPLLEKLAEGGLTEVEKLNLRSEAATNMANAAAAKYQALKTSKADEGDIKAAFQRWVTLANEADQAAKDAVEADVRAKQDLATYFRNSGDYWGSINALDAAAAALRAAAAQPGLPEDQKIAKLNEAAQVGQQATELRITAATEGLKLAQSRHRGSQAQADDEVKIAKETLRVTQEEFALGNATADQVTAAQIAYNQTLHNQADQTQAHTQAKYALDAAREMDEVQRARDQYDAALQAAAYAENQYGKGSTEHLQALQNVTQTYQGLREQIKARADAIANLAIAIAEAAGNTVLAAQLRANQARQKLADALKASGGKRTNDVINAETEAVNANAAARDAAFQDQMDTIQFNLQMGRITANGAIEAYRQMLKATNLTKQQRRELELAIKGLQDDLRSQLTGSGFNIPDQIKLPTPYEVRRSLGIDPYRKQVQGLATELGQMQKGSLSGIVTGPGATSSDGRLVSAMDAVREAVIAQGAQITNDVTITNQVSTPAMVTEIARKVVELINTQTRTGARANQSTPKLVSY